MVDSNVLIDVVSDDPTWGAWSAGRLADAAETGRLIINAIIYAEVSTRFSRIEDVERALPRDMLDREAIPYEAAFLAAKAFVDYRRRGGARTAPLPDFLIGAHATIAGHSLLTRDAARYRTYFPKLDVIAPS
ncbi:MAG: type II toxin-antitoxin system VapC family toxin [Phenylobacterium sp.]|nr:type II toxin-antitoxin system VapC family toxin [Phenylobacterium sp.]TAL33424.1 MAG: type II toxin-antitoxin system VapC family toxin [Phenylobacterium sp.]